MYIYIYTSGEILLWCIIIVDWLVCWDFFDTCSIKAAFRFMLEMGSLGFFSIFFDDPKEFLADVPKSMGLNLKHGPGYSLFYLGWILSCEKWGDS